MIFVCLAVAFPFPIPQKGHIQEWIDSHESWKSPATHRRVLAIENAAFNRAAGMFDVADPIKRLKKPKGIPRPVPLEQALYDICVPCFSNFLLSRREHMPVPARIGSQLAEVPAEQRTKRLLRADHLQHIHQGEHQS